MRPIVLFVAVALALPAAAAARESRDRGLQIEAPHLQLGIGFHGGARSWGDAPFAWADDDGTELAGATGPFDRAPFQDTLGLGPAAELRYVTAPLRLTLGYRPTFPDWSGRQAERATSQSGERVASAAGGAYAHELRFGLGVEAPSLGAVTPFIDVMGDLCIVQAQLIMDSQQSELTSTTYALVPRVGLRVMLKDSVFLEVAGEHGVFGTTRYGGHVMLGVVTL
jgi:hypothetical protein